LKREYWKHLLTAVPLFAAAVTGVLVGFFAPVFAMKTSFLGEAFLFLLRSAVIPLITLSIFVAVAKRTERGQLTRIGKRTLLYFFGTGVLACTVGIVISNILLLPAAETLDPGASIDPSTLKKVSFGEILLGLINPAGLLKGRIFQIVLLSVVVGVLCGRFIAPRHRRLIANADRIRDWLMDKIKKGILVVGPLGIFSLIAVGIVVTKKEMKWERLGWFMLAVLVAALIHILVTLPVVGFYIGRFAPYRFINGLGKPVSYALLTASSALTMPVSKETLEEGGVSPDTTEFVLPLGASLNMDGSGLYQAIVIMFIGKIAGVDFSISEQVLVFLLVMLSSAGTAGIPNGGYVMMGITLDVLGLPPEHIGVYALVDQFWDRFITGANVVGDIFGAKIVDQLERRQRVASVPYPVPLIDPK
jgi:proton glutamate symport protein